MSILEAKYNDLENLKISDYRIETNDLGVGHNISRQLLLIHNMIDYKQNFDCEQKYIAAIVVNVKLAT